MKKNIRTFFIILEVLIMALRFFLGSVLFLITRPIVSLSHIIMGNYHTAKDAIIEYEPRINPKDFF